MSKSERRIWNNKIRRQRELRKNILLTVLTICLVITLSFIVCGFLSNAKTGEEGITFKYYKSIMVDNGDTLWSIAAENKASGMDTEVFVKEIKKINGLHEDKITMGNYLIVPYYLHGFPKRSN